MKRETIGPTAYRLIFNSKDTQIVETQIVQSPALLQALLSSGGYKPRTVWVLDGGWKCVDQESIDICWAKICWNKSTIARLLTRAPALRVAKKNHQVQAA